MKEQAKTGNKVIGYVLLAVMAVSFLYFGVYKVATGQAQMDVQTAFLKIGRASCRERVFATV